MGAAAEKSLPVIASRGRAPAETIVELDAHPEVIVFVAIMLPSAVYRT